MIDDWILGVAQWANPHGGGGSWTRLQRPKSQPSTHPCIFRAPTWINPETLAKCSGSIHDLWSHLMRMQVPLAIYPYSYFLMVNPCKVPMWSHLNMFKLSFYMGIKSWSPKEVDSEPWIFMNFHPYGCFLTWGILKSPWVQEWNIFKLWMVWGLPTLGNRHMFGDSLRLIMLHIHITSNCLH